MFSEARAMRLVSVRAVSLRSHNLASSRRLLIVAHRSLTTRISASAINAPSSGSIVPSRQPFRPRQYATESHSAPSTNPPATGSANTPTPSASTSAPSHPALDIPDHLDAEETSIYKLLLSALEPTELEVQDISGGCGSMYALSITSERFRGLSTMKQHRLVNSVLGDRLKGWHGVQIKCFVPGKK